MRIVTLVVAVLSACACGSRATPSAPTPATAPVQTPSAATPIHWSGTVAGQVIDIDTSAPIPNAAVTFSYPATTVKTDNAGAYVLVVPPVVPGPILVNVPPVIWVAASGYETDTRYFATPAQNFRMHPIVRVGLGEPHDVTVSPDDSMCSNAMQELWGGALGQEYVCRTVRIVAPFDGVMQLQAASHSGGSAFLELERANEGTCCYPEQIGNPVSLLVTAGTEILLHVEIPHPSSVSQTFTVTSSMTQ